MVLSDTFPMAGQSGGSVPLREAALDTPSTDEVAMEPYSDCTACNGTDEALTAAVSWCTRPFPTAGRGSDREDVGLEGFTGPQSVEKVVERECEGLLAVNMFGGKPCMTGTSAAVGDTRDRSRRSTSWGFSAPLFGIRTSERVSWDAT